MIGPTHYESPCPFPFAGRCKKCRDVLTVYRCVTIEESWKWWEPDEINVAYLCLECLACEKDSGQTLNGLPLFIVDSLEPTPGFATVKFKGKRVRLRQPSVENPTG